MKQTIGGKMMLRMTRNTDHSSEAMLVPVLQVVIRGMLHELVHQTLMCLPANESSGSVCMTGDAGFSPNEANFVSLPSCVGSGSDRKGCFCYLRKWNLFGQRHMGYTSHCLGAF